MEIEQIIAEHGDYLLKVAYLYVKNEATAEDIVQDVFIAFYQKQQQFRQESSLRTYLVKMTVNRSHDYLRSWKSKRLSLFEKIVGRTTTITPEKELLAKSTKQELVAALFTLSVPYREVLILYYFEEMTTVDIAKLVHCPEATIRTRLQRARKQLASIIGDDDWEVLRYESI
ncbi:sigma-70 family RNA polymerase sigma factor [Lysinibacillus mangiferihumi]|uniref:Sigma-70 family RNA polymerase sigma factor n=1 Tax=Lysinibacillus mangiferihumi TaxID=1130819 RepID=A0A4U2Y3L2_9BACI|nr:sigma-70 family RNA polymerase sigma factor [Lysinibacillus mangiferihumi]TKI53761.1 sigma-70 family RNA polymerase sigma factor [Lysinibacillus mangiferihumi]